MPSVGVSFDSFSGILTKVICIDFFFINDLACARELLSATVGIDCFFCSIDLLRNKEVVQLSSIVFMVE